LNVGTSDCSKSFEAVACRWLAAAAELNFELQVSGSNSEAELVAKRWVEGSQLIRLSEEQLRPVLESLLTKQSLFAFDAKTVVSRLFDADRLGLHPAGVASAPELLESLKRGDADPRGRLITRSESTGTAALDGSRALGMIAATQGMELAIQRARETGIGLVTVGNSQPLGHPGVYADLAARAGLIGGCLTTSGQGTVSAVGEAEFPESDQFAEIAFPTGAAGQPVRYECRSIEFGIEERDWLQSLGLAEISAGSATLATFREVLTDIAPQGARFSVRGGEAGWVWSLLGGLVSGPLAGGKTPWHKRHAARTANDSEHLFVAIDPARLTDTARFEREVQSTCSDLKPVLEKTPWHWLVGLTGLIESGADPTSAGAIPVPKSIAADLRARGVKAKLEVSWPGVE
jgi:L-2-hydroxycarboxylate dehydrogenase (NAD+)